MSVSQVVLTVFTLLLFSLVLRQALVLVGQHWIRTYAHTMTLLLLPVVTYTITSVIAGNIALSLGLVGALSIVRFRNPVKSPFELVVYFLFITLGITASVSLKWTIMLILAVVFVVLVAHFLDRVVKSRSGESLFQVSFSEGNELPTVEFSCSSQIEALFNDTGLVSYSTDKSQFDYVVAARNKAGLLALVEAYSDDERVQSIRYATY